MGTAVRTDHHADAARDARQAGLRYLCDETPGLRRRRRGKGFQYLDAAGRPIASEKKIAWLRSLAIPPAWENVWICPHENGHLLATGVDEKGRKQYLYHPEWTRRRNNHKFDEMATFGEALPIVRRRVRRDLGRDGLPREKVVAGVVRLMDEALIRVGHEAYTAANGSFGATTLRDQHVRFNGHGEIRLRYRAKSGRERECLLNDPALAVVMAACQELPGQELFQYVDAEGGRHVVDSGDVNGYLLDVTGEHRTAKDFRTWGGTVVAAEAFVNAGPPIDEDKGEALTDKALKKREVAAVRAASKALHNTVATCRSFYVHPRLMDAYAKGWLHEAFEKARKVGKPAELRVAERAVLFTLERLT